MHPPQRVKQLNRPIFAVFRACLANLTTKFNLTDPLKEG